MNTLLRGVRILDLSRLLPGPFCSLQLAQLGAEVIKIEEPQGGDYARALFPELFALVNRGKQSVTLDLRQQADAETFRRMAQDADVVLESFRPGVMDKLGCGYAALKTCNPRLVYAAITGYGQTGPWAQRAGHDMNYNGYAGVLDQTGTPGGPPTLSNVQIADLAGGALTAAMGILAAVIGARQSGHGAFVDVGMMDGALALQTLAVAGIRTTGHARPRGSDMLSGGLPNYRVYACADGGYVAMAALEPKFFANFCKAVQRPDLAQKPLAPGPAGAPLVAELEALFKTRSRDEWDRLLGDQDCCVSAILNPEEALRTIQAQARGMVGQEQGKPVLHSPVRVQDAVAVALAPAPALGAHNPAR